MREMAHIPNWRIAYSGYFDAWVGRMKDDNGGLLGTGETVGDIKISRVRNTYPPAVVPGVVSLVVKDSAVEDK